MISKTKARKKRVASRARWKNVERTAAAKLTEILSDVGMSPMLRIPVLGREGPDLTINESRLVVNVKSRKRILKRLFATQGSTLACGELIGFRLSELLNLRNLPHALATEPWKTLQEWYDLMDKWTKEFEPDGISCIILHHPNMSIDNATVVIHQNNLRRLVWQLEAQQHFQLRFDLATSRSATVPA